MQVPTKARLAVAAIAASAVSMGVAAPSFAATGHAPSNTGSGVTPNVTTPPVTGTKTPVTVTVTQDPAASATANDKIITWSIPAGATAPTGTWSVNFHDASGTGATGKTTAPAGTLTLKHTFVLPAGATYGTFSVSISASDKATGNTWSGSTSVTIGKPSKGGAVAPTVTVAPGLTVAVNTAVTVTATNGAVAAGGVMHYDFDFGDPAKTPLNTQVITPGTDAAKTGVASYTYTAIGTYKVAVTTTDGTNKAVSAVQTINVTAAGTTPPPPPPPTTGGPNVVRVSGADRYTTGIAISSKYATGSANAVVLATGDNAPDALAGVPLAKKVGGPLLLMPAAGPNPAVVAEVNRVLKTGGTVYVLGGQKALPDASLVGITGAKTRIAGIDRYDTSVQIAIQGLGSPKNVVLATGTGFADALSAGPYAADVFGGTAVGSTPAAVLLTADTVIPTSVQSYLTNNAVTNIAAVGGQAATAAGARATKVFKGLDRFDTAAQVASQFSGEKVAGVAVGAQFADALTGAAFLATNNGPLLLTNTGDVPAATQHALAGIGSALGATGVINVFGGTGAITEATRTSIATYAGGKAV